MFGIFAPKYVKEAREMLKSAHKLLCYKRDLWSEVTVADFETQMKKLSDAANARDERAVKEASEQLDAMAGKFSPPPTDAGMRENCEVLLVAIVIAVAVRSYFLQPFTIPTGSMQPTLNGIIGYSDPTGPVPGAFQKITDTVFKGRGYIDVVCKADGVITDMKDVQWLHFFSYTQFECGGQTYTVHAPMVTLERDFGVYEKLQFHKGEIIARGYVDAGDHVFVDKFTYNFRTPQRGDVFVFNTLGVPTNENRGHPNAPSQFYIKRLAGLPGDTLRIDSPELFINGKRATEPGFVRVMSRQDGYRGYGFVVSPGYMSPVYLTSADSSFTLPPKCYFALGDNSYNSSDSRFWGTVPERNISGRGLFVYWPFTSHWGLIK